VSGLGVLGGPVVKVIHVLRKPLSEKSVAANVLRHGTGAVNVDGCRVRMSDADRDFILKTARPNTSGVSHVGTVMNRPQSPTVSVHEAGRWPANLVLQHLPGCRPPATGAGAGCAPGCPVAGLDDQSGVLHSQDPATRKGRAGNHGLGDNPTFFGIKETGDHKDSGGGASRFFKQVGGDGEGSEE